MANVRRLGLMVMATGLACAAGCGKKERTSTAPAGDGPKPGSSAVMAAPEARDAPSAVATGPSPRDQVAAYTAAYAAFSEDLRSRVLAIKSRGPKIATLQDDVTAVLDWATSWSNAHPAPAAMGPPLRQGEFPDRDGLRPNPNYAFQRADVEAMLDQLHKVKQGDLTALFHP